MSNVLKFELSKISGNYFWFSLLLPFISISLLMLLLIARSNSHIEFQISNGYTQDTLAFITIRNLLGHIGYSIIFSIWIAYLAIHQHQQGIWARYTLSGLSWYNRSCSQLLTVSILALLMVVMVIINLLILINVINIPFKYLVCAIQWRTLVPMLLVYWFLGLWGALLGNAIRSYIVLPLIIIYSLLEMILDDSNYLYWNNEIIKFLPGILAKNFILFYPSLAEISALTVYLFLIITSNALSLKHPQL